VIHSVADEPLVFWPVDVRITGKRLAESAIRASKLCSIRRSERECRSARHTRPSACETPRRTMTSRHRRRQWYAPWPGVIAILVFALACNRAASGGRRESTVSAGTLKIDDLLISDFDSGLIFQYRTPTSSTDCKAQAAELPKVWESVVWDRLRHSQVHSVILFPEDPSGTSVSMEFTKSSSGQWTTAAPCSITIPNGVAP